VFNGLSQIVTLCRALDKRSDFRDVFNPRGNGTKAGRECLFRLESAVTKKSAEWICERKVLTDREHFSDVHHEEESREYRIRFIQLREVLNRNLSIVRVFWHDDKTTNNIFEMVKMLKSAIRTVDHKAGELIPLGN
jgi:hypothetical protein